MSIQLYTCVVCDDCGRCVTVNEHSPRKLTAKARKHAASVGFTKPKGDPKRTDLCSLCSGKIPGTEPDLPEWKP